MSGYMSIGCCCFFALSCCDAHGFYTLSIINRSTVHTHILIEYWSSLFLCACAWVLDFRVFYALQPKVIENCFERDIWMA